jgi:hypothetical protein
LYGLLAPDIIDWAFFIGKMYSIPLVPLSWLLTYRMVIIQVAERARPAKAYKTKT